MDVSHASSMRCHGRSSSCFHHGENGCAVQAHDDPPGAGSWLLDLPIGLLHLCRSLQEAEAHHVLDMAWFLVRERQLASAFAGTSRDRIRVVHSAANRLLRVVQVTRALCQLPEESPPPPTIRSLLRRDADPIHLVGVLARGMAYLNRRIPGRSGIHTAKVRTQAEMFNHHFHMLIRSGLFEPTTPADTRLSVAGLHATMFHLETVQPNWYSALPSGPRRMVHKPEMTAETLERLLEAASTREERAYVRLSGATGLRAAALARLTVPAVWEEAKGEVCPVIALSEKNSDVRRVYMAALPQVAEALADFMRHEHPGPTVTMYVFHNRRCPWRPAWRYAALTLQRLCERAGLPPHNHHQWRRLIVNHPWHTHAGAAIQSMCHAIPSHATRGEQAGGCGQVPRASLEFHHLQPLLDREPGQRVPATAFDADKKHGRGGGWGEDKQTPTHPTRVGDGGRGRRHLVRLLPGW